MGENAVLARQSIYRYRLKATGRRNVRGLQAIIEVRSHSLSLSASLTAQLVRRHDAVSLLLRLFNIAADPDMIVRLPAAVSPRHQLSLSDVQTIDVPLRDQAMDAYVFAIVKRKLDADFRKDNPDVVRLTPPTCPCSASWR